MQRRFAVREHIIDVREPAPHFALQPRFAVRRRQALAVNDAYATKAAGTRLAQEPAERFVRLMRRQAMQIELGLNDPASPPQPGEHIGAEPGPEKRLLAFDLLTDVPRVRRRFVSVFRSVKSVAFIQQCLFRPRRRLWPRYAGLFCRGETRDVREGVADIDIAGGVLLRAKRAFAATVDPLCGLRRFAQARTGVVEHRAKIGE